MKSRWRRVSFALCHQQLQWYVSTPAFVSNARMHLSIHARRLYERRKKDGVVTPRRLDRAPEEREAVLEYQPDSDEEPVTTQTQQKKHPSEINSKKKRQVEGNADGESDEEEENIPKQTPSRKEQKKRKKHDEENDVAGREKQNEKDADPSDAMNELAAQALRSCYFCLL